MNRQPGTQCRHVVGLQHHVVHGPQVGETCRMLTAGIVRAVPHNSYKLGGEGLGPVLSPGAPADTSVAGREAGAGRAEQLCTAATCATAGAEDALPGALVRPTPGGGRRRGRRGSGRSGRAGEQGVKRGRRQRACQTRACAVCTASVLWVSAAAAAAAAGGSARPGQRRLQPPGPRAAAAGADTQCGTRRGAEGPAAWGRGTAGNSTRGEPELRAWGRGAGGAGERPESRRGRRSGSLPGRRRSWPHLHPAGGRRGPALARCLGSAPVGAPDAGGEAFSPLVEVAARGGQRRVRGAREWCGDGEDGAAGLGALPDPSSSLLSVSKRLPGLEPEPQIRRCARAWLPCGGWAHKGACWGRGARWQLSPLETKGYRGGAAGWEGASGDLRPGRLTSPLSSGGRAPLRPPWERRGGRQFQWELGSQGMGVRNTDPSEFEAEDFPVGDGTVPR